MKSYEFPYSCDEWRGSIEFEISKKEVNLIKAAYRNAFDCLEDDSDLDALREKVLDAIADETSLDNIEDLDIRIYFPEEITDEVDEEDE